MITIRVFGTEYTTEHSLDSREFIEFVTSLVTEHYPNATNTILEMQESQFNIHNIAEIMHDVLKGKKIFKSAPVKFCISINDVQIFEPAFIIVDTLM